jgi:hypothetical protein
VIFLVCSTIFKMASFVQNFAMPNLIPKVEDAMDMKNFRPISPLNCSFKIYSVNS